MVMQATTRAWNDSSLLKSLFKAVIVESVLEQAFQHWQSSQ
jgi:hypothetical protein